MIELQDAQQLFQLKSAVNLLQTSLALDILEGQWQLHSAHMHETESQDIITIETVGHMALTGLAIQDRGQFLIFLDARSIWALVGAMLYRNFDAHQRQWPHSIGL